jgi:speckle-type POZ protein
MVASVVLATRKMTSRCSPVADRCTHMFEIHGYTLQEGLGVGKALRSPTFAFGGHEWRISYYPDGHDQRSSGYASVFLDFMGNDTCPVGTKVRGFVSLDVINPITGEPMYINPGGGRLNIMLDV